MNLHGSERPVAYLLRKDSLNNFAFFCAGQPEQSTNAAGCTKEAGMRLMEKNLSATARGLIASLVAAMLVAGSACSLFNTDQNGGTGDVQGQPAVLEPVAGRLSQVSGDVAINHQIDVANTNGAQSAPESQPIAQPTTGI